MNPGLIWVDESSAANAIESRVAAGEITTAEGANLHKFADDGYCILEIDFSASDGAEFDREVDRLGREKPPDIAFAWDSPPLRFSVAEEARQRRPRYRIHDLHSRFELARRLYLHPLLHRYASLILGQPAVATQSLYFEFGSQQVLHRDSIVVPTPKFGHLVAAWIALEDIDPQSGALAYVPGSQKIPFYEFAPGEACSIRAAWAIRTRARRWRFTTTNANAAGSSRNSFSRAAGGFSSGTRRFCTVAGRSATST